MFDELLVFFGHALFQSLGRQVAVEHYLTLGGGSISPAVVLQTAEGSFFLKFNKKAPRDMFETEAKGLQVLRQTGAIGIPEVLGVGQDFLLLEFMTSRQEKADFWADFGQSLAKLHTHTSAQFGLEHDNYIGYLPQYNTQMADGIGFFTEQRLRVQADKALKDGWIESDLHQKFETLYKRLPDLFPAEKPALLHGDLWSGNVMSNAEGAVTLIDPAVHYGLREAELAFTRMFGGFNERFYEAYNEVFPLEPGYDERADLYNLYPLLVHVNMFGQSYVGAVRQTLEKYC